MRGNRPSANEMLPRPVGRSRSSLSRLPPPLSSLLSVRCSPFSSPMLLHPIAALPHSHHHRSASAPLPPLQSGAAAQCRRYTLHQPVLHRCTHYPHCGHRAPPPTPCCWVTHSPATSSSRTFWRLLNSQPSSQSLGEEEQQRPLLRWLRESTIPCPGSLTRSMTRSVPSTVPCSPVILPGGHHRLLPPSLPASLPLERLSL